MRTGLEHLPIVQSQLPHPPQTHGQVTRDRHRRNGTVLLARVSSTRRRNRETKQRRCRIWTMFSWNHREPHEPMLAGIATQQRLAARKPSRAVLVLLFENC